jgi:hypothetical protein
MGQTILVMLMLLGVSLYLVRYFLRAYRTEGSPCGGCTVCCSHHISDMRTADHPKQSSLNPSCQDGKRHDHQAYS